MTDINFLDQVAWNVDGLVPAIAQDAETGEVLMMAWMNRDALQATVREGKAVYWSRSRQKLWRKGEQSGHEQIVRELRIDCDFDSVLMRVDQKGGIACHTGRKSCFYLVNTDEQQWKAVDPVLKDPKQIYAG